MDQLSSILIDQSASCIKYKTLRSARTALPKHISVTVFHKFNSLRQRDSKKESVCVEEVHSAEVLLGSPSPYILSLCTCAWTLSLFKILNDTVTTFDVG
jgi:hypothetical protein